MNSFVYSVSKSFVLKMTPAPASASVSRAIAFSTSPLGSFCSSDHGIRVPSELQTGEPSLVRCPPA